MGYLFDLWKNNNQLQNKRTTWWLVHHDGDNIPLLNNILREKRDIRRYLFKWISEVGNMHIL